MHQTAPRRIPAAPSTALAGVCLGLLLAAAVMPGCRASQRRGSDTAEQAAVDLEKRWRAARDLVAQGLRAEERGDYDRAIDSYVGAIEKTPDFGAAWHNLGVAFMMRGEHGDNVQAKKAFIRAADLDSSDPRPLFNLGVMYHRIGYPRQAQEYYDAALERDPDYLPALRESVYLDHIRATGDDVTAERVRRALLLESDPEWRETLMRVAQRLREGER